MESSKTLFLSGTLKPTEEFDLLTEMVRVKLEEEKSDLFEKEDISIMFSCGHVVKKENIGALTVPSHKSQAFDFRF